MSLKLIPAALVAVAALAAASSFAQDMQSQTNTSSQLMDAQSRGYSLSSSNPYSPPMPQMGAANTPESVMSDLRDAQSRGYSLSSTNPYPPRSW